MKKVILILFFLFILSFSSCESLFDLAGCWSCERINPYSGDPDKTTVCDDGEKAKLESDGWWCTD